MSGGSAAKKRLDNGAETGATEVTGFVSSRTVGKVYTAIYGHRGRQLQI